MSPAVAMTSPGRDRRRSVHGVEHRQQRQLHRQYRGRRRHGRKCHAGELRDHLRPGPQRRWHDRHYQSGDPDHRSTTLTLVAHTPTLFTTMPRYRTDTGPGGSAVTAGEFAGWTAIAAVQVAGGGYDVAWKNTSADQYTVWSTRRQRQPDRQYRRRHRHGRKRHAGELRDHLRSGPQRRWHDRAAANFAARPIRSTAPRPSFSLQQLLPRRQRRSTLGPEVKQGGTAVTAGSSPAGRDRRRAGRRRRLRHRLERDRAPISTRCGAPTATATRPAISRAATSREKAPRWRTSRPSSVRTSTAMAPSELPLDHRRQDATSNGPTMANLYFAAGSPAESFRSGNDNFHFNSGPTGQTPASPVGGQNGTTASAGQDGFTFGAANSMSSAHSIDPMLSHSTTFANTHHSADDHSIWTAAHDETFGNSTAPDAVHWLAHQHSGFHIA